MKKLLVVIAALSLWAGPSLAQSTKAQINTEITTNFPDNTSGQITPLGLRTVTSDIVNSIMPTAPVVSGNLACFSGTTGLLQDCGIVPSLLVPGTTKIIPSTSNGLLYASATFLQSLPTAANGILKTDGGGIPSISSSLPSGLVFPDLTVTSSSANALAVGQNGTTNPAFRVDDSAVGQATGILVLANAAGGGSGIIATSSATNEPISLNAKNAGAIFIGNASTGAVTIAPATTLSGALTYGGVTLSNAVTGTGPMVLGTSPTLTTPILGVAAATSVNKVAITAPATSATLTIANGTTLTETSSTSVGQGQYLGEASTGSATAGNIGEVMDGALALVSATPLVTATPKTVASVTLTPGQWEISGSIYFTTAAGTSVTQTAISLSPTTNTIDFTIGRWSWHTFGAIVPGAITAMSENVPPTKVSISTNTTFFLVAQSTFTVAGNSASGVIHAIRSR